MLYLNNHTLYNKIVKIIPPKQTFNRSELLSFARQIHPDFSNTSLRNLLEFLLKNGIITRVGRNQYISIISSKRKHTFTYHYSQESIDIINLLESQFPHLECCVWELTWLNEFLNHQVAQNKIFVEVESIGCGYVFDALNKKYCGNILLTPSDKELYLYGKHNTIIVCKLVSESPKGKNKYENTLEKMLVDLFANKIIKHLIHPGERQSIALEIINKYYIDKSKLSRYAARRNKKEIIEQLLSEYNTSQL